MILFLLLTFSSAVLYEALALFIVLRKEYRSQTSLLFSGICHLFALWALSYTFMYATTDRSVAWFWYRMSAIGWCMAPAVGLHFYLSISKVGEGALWRKATLFLYYSAGIAFLVRTMSSYLVAGDLIRQPYYWREVIVQPDSWLLVFLAYATGNVVIGTGAVIRWMQNASTRRETKQARLILISQTTAYVMIVVSNVLLPFLEITLIPSVGVALNIVWVALIWRSIDRYRLFALTPESMAELIIKKITDGIMLLDARLVVSQANPRALSFLNLREDEVIGRPIQDFFFASTPIPLNPAEPSSLENLEVEFEATLAGRTAPLPVRANASVIRDRDHDLMGILLILRDVSQLHQLEKEIADRKTIEGQLVLAMKKANAATEAKSDFLAKISHEMRTPLNSILGMTQLLSESNLDAEKSGYLKIAERSAETLLDLIDDLLDIARIEAGHLQIDERPFKLLDLVDETITLIDHRAKTKGIRLETRLDAGLPPYLIGDPIRVKQILLNLLGNAVKFTERGYVRLDITTESKEGPLHQILFTLQDTGIGIPADRQASLFERFAQVDSGITRRYGGSGLGLAITRELVRRMNGDVWFKSDAGQGSTFFVRLPFREPREASPLPEDSGNERPTGDDAAIRLSELDMRILLVEDNPENVALFLAFLKKSPLKIDLAENGAEALERVRENAYDLIFMDMQMPVMDGYTAVAEIRKREEETHLQHTPIIAFTAHALIEEEEKSRTAGCDGHLTKPLKKSRLIETILHYAK